MSKAEERALEKYPPIKIDREGEVISGGFDNRTRKLYIEGYEAAEKDLALTWEDASVIVTIAMDIIGEGEIHGEQNIYTEVLKRFKEARK